MLNMLFRIEGSHDCPASLDCNSDDVFDIGDPSFLLFYRFLGGGVPLGPFPDCDTNENAQSGLPELDCFAHEVCF